MVSGLSSQEHLGLRDDSLRSVAQTMLLLSKNTTMETRAANSSLVAAMSRPEAIGSIIREVLADRRTLTEIARRSYRHAANFDEIVLIDSLDIRSYRLTLRVWDPPYTEEEIADASIHDHRFSFWHAVLVGSLTTETFTRDASGMPFNEYQCVPEKHGELTVGERYTLMGLTYLAAGPVSVAEPGIACYLPYHRIHRVVFPDDLACALVMRGPRQRNYTSVYNNYRPLSSYRHEMFSPAELAEKLILVRDNLPAD